MPMNADVVGPIGVHWRFPSRRYEASSLDIARLLQLAISFFHSLLHPLSVFADTRGESGVASAKNLRRKNRSIACARFADGHGADRDSRGRHARAEEIVRPAHGRSVRW